MPPVWQTIAGQLGAVAQTAATTSIDPGIRMFWVLVVCGILLAVILGFIAWAVLQAYSRAQPAETPELEEISARGHEIRDSQPRIVIGFLVILFFTTTFILVAGLGLFSDFMRKDVAENQPPTPELLVTDQTPPKPRLQADPTVDLNRFRQEEERLLNSYGWVDQAHGIVRIPIQQAMELIARQGLPPGQGQPRTTTASPLPAPRATNTSARQP